MTQPTGDNRIRKAARALAKQGLRPLPVKPGEKHPYLKWTNFLDTYNYLQLASEFTPDKGLWTACGVVTMRVVLDCDNDAAVQLWRERLAEQFDRTARVKTRKGLHLWFNVPVGTTAVPTWNQQSDPEALERGARYDVRGDGAGVMLPPSRHADDPSFVYEWEVLPEAALEAPAILLTKMGGASPTSGERDPSTTAKTGRSLLSALLLNPPDEGGRNDWHAKVAGHVVKMRIPFLDAYESLGLALNQALPHPLDEEEVLKTWRHRWDQEAEEKTADLGTPETGMLSGNGTEIFTVVRQPIGKDQFQLVASPWLNGDVIADGVIDSDSTGRTYAVRVQRKDGLVHTDMVQPGLLGSANDTNKWLAKHGLSVMSPGNEEKKGIGHPGQRLLRYLESQKPDAYRAVPYLGWHADIGFVTHEGVITASGMRPHEGVMPDTLLRDLAPYHYGMGEASAAREVLREVLTFQDSTVTAVFGAWWAACLLKGHIVDMWGHFPYFLINAASESGKTRGFFRMMLSLSGSTKFGIGTRASTRDYIGSHRNGIVHIDDPDDVDNLAELLRAAAGEATISKKGQDNRSTVETKMVAPILISGESLGLSDEKAQRDRSISIDVPSPIGRMSLRDSDRPQIDDIKALEREHPDLTAYAGTFVQMALQQAKTLESLPALRGPAGRHYEIKAIIRLGARVLATMVAGNGYDESWIVETVDRWAANQQDLGQANSLLIKVLPWALSDERWAFFSSSVGGPPAYIDRQGLVWVNVERLAAAWQKECRQRGINDRLGTEDAIRAQLRAIGCVDSVSKWIVSKSERDTASGERRIRYYALAPEYAAMVLGDAPDDGEPEPPARGGPPAGYGRRGRGR